MRPEEIKNKFYQATKWSTISEIAAKVIQPISSMILARIISPEAFGVVATVTMIITFTEMFSDAGFQKYLIQHEFKSTVEKFKFSNVAFWTNMFISTILFFLIIVFNEHIALIVGNPGKGYVIIFASIQLFTTSFSSIQMALYKRDFDFKTLFYSRIVSVCIPIFVTIPLAFWGLSYWSIIIGNLVSQISIAIVLTIKSKWKPKYFYNFNILKRMFSFSFWNLVESISIWLTSWVDVFIISNVINQYYLGIYKTSTILVNAIFSIIVSSVVPVLFSALSRLQNDREKFVALYFKIQKYVAFFVLPLGIILYFYSDLATSIMLGSKWKEASDVIGVWALTSSIMVVFAHFSSEVYRSLGRPKLSFLAQLLHLVVLVPVCIYSSNFGFWPLVYSRAWIRMEFVIVHLLFMQYFIGINIKDVIFNLKSIIVSVTILFLFNIIAFYAFKPSFNAILILLIISILIYFNIIIRFNDIKNEIKFLKSKFLKSK